MEEPRHQLPLLWLQRVVSRVQSDISARLKMQLSLFQAANTMDLATQCHVYQEPTTQAPSSQSACLALHPNIVKVGPQQLEQLAPKDTTVHKAVFPRLLAQQVDMALQMVRLFLLSACSVMQPTTATLLANLP